MFFCCFLNFCFSSCCLCRFFLMFLFCHSHPLLYFQLYCCIQRMFPYTHTQLLLLFPFDRQWTRHDPRREPRTGERVPYVIVYGAPGLPLIQLVRCPSTVLVDASLRLNATYYITHAILPPLHRCLGLLGVDVNTW